MTFPNIAF